MKEEPNFFLQLSLQEMSRRKVAVLLSTDSSILTSISESFYKFKTKKFRRNFKEIIEGEIEEKMLQLQLPGKLKNPIIDMTRQIISDIRRWMEIHQTFLEDPPEEFSLTDANIFHWSPEGAVDYKKTAEKLINSDRLDVVKRYEIASYYCLEDSIPFLWEKLPEDRKEYFGNDKNLSLDLPFCWPHILKGEFSKLNYYVWRKHSRNKNFNQFSFERSAKRGNKTAAEYFFQRLTDEERRDSLVITVPRVLFVSKEETFFPQERHSDLILYLLSVMSPQEQIKIVKAHPVRFFASLLDWPWQELFLQNVGLLWTDQLDCYTLLEKMKTRFNDPYFSNWFKDFFKQSSAEFRNNFSSYYLSKFFDSNDEESIKTMFRVVDAADRLELVSNNFVFENFFKIFLFDGLDRVKRLLKEATLSKEDGRKLKEAFRQYLENTVRGQCVNRKFREFFSLLDEIHLIM